MPATQVSKSQCTELQSNPGYYLLRDAAYAWDRAVAEFGKVVLITGAWRSYETQERIFLERYQTAYIQYAPGKVDARPWRGRTWYRKPGTAAAAVPGTSNHGGGLAVDVKTKREKGDPPFEQAVIFGSWTDTDRTRFLRVAAEHGWDDDEGRSVDELWHLTYYAARDQHRGKKPTTTIQEELDMAGLDPTQAAHLRDINARTKELLEKVLELHSGVAPRIDVPWETPDGKVTTRTADAWLVTKLIQIEKTVGSTSVIEAAVAAGVKKVLDSTPGADEAALTAGVVAEVRKTLEAIEKQTYVLSPEEK